MTTTSKKTITELNSNEIKNIHGGTNFYHTDIGVTSRRIDPSILTDDFRLPMPRPPKKQPNEV